jgi:myo-inositol-1(or 4)-monophosphatase
MAAADALEADWLGFSREAFEAGRSALARFPERAARSEHLGRGEGGDMTLAIDGAVEDAVFEELERLDLGVRVVSEERGLVEVGGGGPVQLVIDPIDGSLNAKRRLPQYSISIAVANGDDMSAVEFAYVANFATGEEWWAEHGRGAWADGEPLKIDCAQYERLEILGVESAHPWLVSAHADALAETRADRMRMLGSLALSLCYVASTRFDGLISLRPVRSVDVAAGQLIVREAGGGVAFPDAGYDGVAPGLDLGMRSRVVAAASEPILELLIRTAEKVDAQFRRAHSLPWPDSAESTAQDLE